MFDFNLEFARGGAKVTTELFELLADGGVKQNIIFSPFSIQACAALAFAGASGETADQIAEGLKFALGIDKIFSDEAEFINMLAAPEALHVSNVFHKAVIEVNEEATEAAAATAMVMMTRCMLVDPQFIADRPFFYAIWNKRNILFAGAFVNAPTA